MCISVILEKVMTDSDPKIADSVAVDSATTTSFSFISL